MSIVTSPADNVLIGRGTNSSEVPRSRTLSRGQLIASLILAALLAAMTFRMSFLLGPNSDIYFGAAIARDIRLGIPLSGWEMAPPAFLFPDLIPGVFIALLFPGEPAIYLAVHAAFTVLLACGIFWTLAKRLAADRAVPIGPVLSGMLLLIALFLPFGTRLFANLSVVVWPFMHFASIIGGTLLLVVSISRLSTSPKPNDFAVLALTYFLAVSGDVLALPQFVAPLWLTLGVLVLRKVIAPRILVAHIAAFTSAYLLLTGAKLILNEAFLIHIPNATTWIPNLQALPENIRIAWSVFAPIALSCWWLMVICAIWLTISVRRSLKYLFSPPSNEHERREFFFALAGTLILCGTLAAPVLYGNLNVSAHIRYLAPILVLPTLFLSVRFASRGGRVSMQAALGIAAVLACIVPIVQLGLNRFDSKTLHAARDYQMMSDLDEACAKRGTLFGFDNYWLCKAPSVRSSHGVSALAVNPDFSPFTHISNKRWSTNPDGTFGAYESPAYGFVVLGPYSGALTCDKVIQAFGEPAAEESPNPLLRIMYYDRPSDIAFRNYARSPGSRLMKTRAAPSAVTPVELQMFKWSLQDQAIEISPTKPLVVELAPPAPGDVLELLCSPQITLQITGFDAAGNELDRVASAPSPGSRRFVRRSQSLPAARLRIESDQAGVVSYVAIYPDAVRYR
ncbi:MAG: hypothetical protein ACREJD_12115 [Phycisphaerales bacterium]